MLTKEGIDDLRGRLEAVRIAASDFFSRASPQGTADWAGVMTLAILDEETLTQSETLRTQVKRLSVDIAGAARGSPLIAEADLHELRHSTRQMLAALRFNAYSYQGVYVHSDEDRVLGVDPPTHHEHGVSDSTEAQTSFDVAAGKVLDLVELLSPSDTIPIAASTASYRPNTAFIMMMIDKAKPELLDVKNAIKDVFAAFGIHAITADDIEHEGAITDRVLEEIETSEFHIADLTGERPNVYYEVGYAHARNKRVILCRKQDAKLHFDLAHRNVPEYENNTALKEFLGKRLEVLTNRPKKA